MPAGRNTGVCLCRRARPAGGSSYPYGPRTDLIWPGGEEVLQLQGGVARLDDFVQCTGKREIQTIFRILRRHSSLQTKDAILINSINQRDGSLCFTRSTLQRFL